MSIILSRELLSELNQCRTNPRRYSNKLQTTLNFYKGKRYERPGRPPIETQEGISNVESCIKYLKTVRGSGSLKWSESLAEAAKFHLEDIGPQGLTGHIGSDGSDLESRLSRVCVHSGHIGENIDYGNSAAEDIVINLLIDDGMYARGQRLNIMKKDHKFVGAAVGFHSEFGSCCVMVFAEQVMDEGDVGNPAESTLDLEEIKDFTMKGDNSASYLDIGYDISDKLQIKGEMFSIESAENSFKSGMGSELEISEYSGFYDHHDESKKKMKSISEEDSDIMSLSATESLVVVSEKPVPRLMPTTKPPLTPKTKEEKKDEFVVSNFERSELSKDAIVEIKELFDIYDTSGSGFLDANTLKLMKEQLTEGSNSEVIQVLCNIESEGVGTMNFENFVDLFVEKSGISKQKSVSLSKNIKQNNTTVQSYNKGKRGFDPALYMRPEFSRNDIIEIKEAFDLFDVDGTGTINPMDLKQVIKSQGYEQKNPTVYRIIQNLDADDIEKVNFGEFLDLMASEGTGMNSLEEMRRLFSLFDIEKTGFIELKNLRNIVREVGESLDEDEIVELITKSDLDGDGRVSFQDFYNIMNKQIFY